MCKRRYFARLTITFSWFVKSVLSAMSDKAPSLKSLTSVAHPCRSWKKVWAFLYKTSESERNQRQTRVLPCTCSAFEQKLSTDKVLWHPCSAPYLCDCVSDCVCVYSVFVFRCIYLLSHFNALLGSACLCSYV